MHHSNVKLTWSLQPQSWSPAVIVCVCFMLPSGSDLQSVGKAVGKFRPCGLTRQRLNTIVPYTTESEYWFIKVSSVCFHWQWLSKVSSRGISYPLSSWFFWLEMLGLEPRVSACFSTKPWPLWKDKKQLLLRSQHYSFSARHSGQHSWISLPSIQKSCEAGQAENDWPKHTQ